MRDRTNPTERKKWCGEPKSRRDVSILFRPECGPKYLGSLSNLLRKSRKLRKFAKKASKLELPHYISSG